jgi:tetratricopeptide (TPR) repeat protein
MRSTALLFFAGTLACAASPRLEFARGVLAEQRGDAAAAAEAFERARETDPAAFPLMLRVAGRLQEEGDLAGASTLHREFAAAHPERLEAQLSYVDFLRDSSPDDDFAGKMALEVLEKSGERFPGELEVQRRLFRVYESLEQRAKSLGVFEAVAAGPPGHSQTLAAVEMARTLFPKDDPEARARVDDLFRNACRSDPANPVLARAASEHFRTTARLPEAIDILAAHTAADPSSLALRIRTGILMLAAERTEEGERALLDVLAIDPRQSLAHQSLAKLYRKLDRADEARPHAAEVLKIRGGDPSEFVVLADEFLTAGLPREARLLLEKAVFFHPSDPELMVKLAVAARRDPESREKASRLFREAEAMSGTDGPAKDPEFLREFAESLLEGGQTAAAEERLRLAIRAYPAEKKKETAAALRRLAGIWTAGKRNTEAADALIQRADALDPP